MNDKKICVLGAGIVGLTSALSLQNKFQNVTIIASNFTTQTTSDGAAGLFCPFSSFHAATFEIARQIVKDSYEYYEDLRQTYGEVETGIITTSGYVLSNISEEEVKNPLIDEVVPDYTILSQEELKNCPGTWKYGCYFRSLIIQGRIFLPWALQVFQKKGGKIIQTTISSFEDLLVYNFDVIVNCFGLGAKQLCNDKFLVPLRGQVIKVSAPWQKQFFLLDNDVYIIPGIETTLGGSRQYGNYDLNVDKHISAQIWENCTKLLPQLKESPIVREWVGLRPYRIPVRLEPEKWKINDTYLQIVHNYGHGAQGITTAPGCAKIITEIVIKIVQNTSKI